MRQYLIAIGAIVGLMIAWGLVQMLWMKVFPEYRSDVDALAIREGCEHCGQSSCGQHSPAECHSLEV